MNYSEHEAHDGFLNVLLFQFQGKSRPYRDTTVFKLFLCPQSFICCCLGQIQIWETSECRQDIHALPQGKGGQVVFNLKRFLWLIFNENKVGSAQIEQMMRNDLAGRRSLPLRWCWGRRRGAAFPSLFLSSLFFLSLSIILSQLSLSPLLSLPLYVFLPPFLCLSVAMKGLVSSQLDVSPQYKKRQITVMHFVI